jgi:STAS domain
MAALRGVPDPAPTPSVMTAAVRGVDGVTVLKPTGVLTAPLPESLRDAIVAAASKGPLIVDVSEVTLISVAGLVDSLCETYPTPGECCLVCPRGSGRALIQSWRPARRIAVFLSVGDALQARRFERAGYLGGWRADGRLVRASTTVSPIGPAGGSRSRSNVPSRHSDGS